jgi:hypothetical protein
VIGASILYQAILAGYRIDAPITPIQRRLLFWLGKESMHQTHQYNGSYSSGCVKNRGVIGASILYQAREVSGVVLV